MTVVVNAVSAIVGGGASFLRELVSELTRRGVRERFIFYVPPEHADLGTALPTNLEWRVVSMGYAGAGRVWWDQNVTAIRLAGTLRRLWWDQVTLRGILRRERADVLFSTANFALLFSPVPQLLFLQNPLYSNPIYRARFLPRRSLGVRLGHALRRWLQCLSVRQATLLMTPSRALLEELRTAGFVPRGEARVNHFGTRVTPLARRAETDAEASRPFRLFFPAFYYEHKNLGTLLEAVKRLREHHLDVELTTTADPDSPMADAAVTAPAERALARDPALRGHVHFLPNRTPEQLAELYAACDLFVYPTVMESFGFPLIEALAYGLPIVASDIPVNRELAGEAPLYFQPFDPDELARKIAQVLPDPELRARMRAASLERARAYTWSAHVERLLAALEETARGGC